MNTTLKHLAEAMLVRSGVARLVWRSRRGRTLVLAYHNILPNGEAVSGDRNLHLPQSEFSRQLDTILETHEVISIEEIGQPAPTSARPRVIITFDDAYQGALTVGVAELVKRRMPATIFVAPGLIGSVCWWDRLAEHTGGVIEGDLRDYVLGTLRGNAEAIYGWIHSKYPTSEPIQDLQRIGTLAQLTAAASRPGITIGSHTWSHQNLSALGEEDVEGELRRSDQWLRSQFPSVVGWLSYPYGLFTNPVMRGAARAGYLGAFRIDGGWMPRPSLVSYDLPRLNIPSGLSLNGFRLRLSGF